MIDGCVNLKHCLVCGTEVTEILDLGSQPLANSFLDRIVEERIFPLKVNCCKNCMHLQLSHAVDLPLMYKNYLYRSGTTNTYKEYMNWFASNALKYFKEECSTVLDIGCNDGTQLDFFKKLGLQTYGIDPAENLYEYSSKNHIVIKDYFSETINFKTKFDIVLMQNSFAHQPNPKKFLQNIKNIIDTNGKIFIQTSQADMVKNNEFDTIYHEHVSFFNINSMNELVKRTNLTLTDVIKTPVHGISYLFRLTKNTFAGRRKVFNEIEVERQRGLLSKKTYNEYTKNITKLVSDFKELIENSRREGFELIGYGAAAKGMTFLNFADVKLDYILDDNKLKHHLYTPGTNVPIKPNGFLKQYKDCLLYTSDAADE